MLIQWLFYCSFILLMSFKLTDIIVWDGVITTFSVAKPLIRCMGNVRLATNEEKKTLLQTSL